MLTARSIVICAISVAMLSLLGSFITLLQPPDSNGLAADTYGTRAHGYKALFDTLDALNVAERRQLGPPSADNAAANTLILWGPETSLVQVEPVYLARLRQWVRNGGRIVVAPQAKRDTADRLRRLGPGDLVAPTTVLRELGLAGVTTISVDLPTSSGLSGAGEADLKPSSKRGADRDSIKSQFEEYLFPTLFATSRVRAKASGTLSALATNVAELEVPVELQVLELSVLKPDGKIVVESQPSAAAEDKQPLVLAAQFRMGDGEIIVISDPAIFDNRLFSQADNSVLAVQLLTAPNRTIVWDEFYHGLTIRGNPLFLLTRRSYALIAALLVALTAVWVWRKAVFLGPPLAADTVSRRSLGEYVTAMATFLNRGSESAKFMLAELRRGVLWSLRRKFSSNRVQETPQDIAAAVARRDPRRARELLDATRQVDLVLSNQSRVNERELLQVAKDLLDCL